MRKNISQRTITIVIFGVFLFSPSMAFSNLRDIAKNELKAYLSYILDRQISDKEIHDAYNEAIRRTNRIPRKLFEELAKNYVVYTSPTHAGVDEDSLGILHNQNDFLTKALSKISEITAEYREADKKKIARLFFPPGDRNFEIFLSVNLDPFLASDPDYADAQLLYFAVMEYVYYMKPQIVLRMRPLMDFIIFHKESDLSGIMELIKGTPTTTQMEFIAGSKAAFWSQIEKQLFRLHPDWGLVPELVEISS